MDSLINNSNTCSNIINDNNNLKIENKKIYMKKYRTTNMDKWNEKKTCSVCNCVYTSSNTSNHMRSKKHKYGQILLENIKLQQQQNILQPKI